jgi:hypothetical protein
VAFVGADPNPSYAASGLNLAVQDGLDSAFTVDLAASVPTTATADLRFTFSGQSCAAARVDSVRVRVDPDANGFGGIDAGTVPCNANGIDGAIVTGLQPGIHSFAISGIRGATLVYTTTRPPAGRFEVGLTTQVTVDATPAGSGLAPPAPTALSVESGDVRKAPRQLPKAFAVRADTK